MFLNKNNLLHVILCENKNFDNNMNISVQKATIIFIKDFETFDQPLVYLLLIPFLCLHP